MKTFLKQLLKPLQRPRRRGFVFIVTIIGMGAMLATGAGFMGSAAHQLAQARNEYATLHAMAMSSAGVNYAMWLNKFSGGNLNAFSESALANPRQIISAKTPSGHQLHRVSPFDPDDEFYVWIAEIERTSALDPTKKSGGYLAVAKGLYRARSDGGLYRGVRAVWARELGKGGGNLPIPLKYALFSHEDLYLSGGATVINGDIGSNYGPFSIMNNVNLIGGSGTVFYATPGSVQNPIVNKSGYPVVNGAPESFKTWDWTKQHFKDAARWQFTSSTVPTTGDAFFPDAPNPLAKKNIAYITGDTTLPYSYTFSKSGTIVIDGNLTVHGSIFTTSPDVSLVIYCLGNISVTINGGATINAALIAHNDSFTGTMDLKINGNATITGAILADKGVRMNGGFTIYYNHPSDQSPVEPPQPNNLAHGFLSWEVL